jgi:hypothetical protein
MNPRHQSRSNRISHDIPGKRLHILLPPNRTIVVTLLPQPASPPQRLIDRQATPGFDSAHQLRQRSLVQLHQTVHVIRHHNPRQKVAPALLLRLTQLSYDQPTQLPISKKRLSLINDNR